MKVKDLAQNSTVADAVSSGSGVHDVAEMIRQRDAAKRVEGLKAKPNTAVEPKLEVAEPVEPEPEAAEPIESKLEAAEPEAAEPGSEEDSWGLPEELKNVSVELTIGGETQNVTVDELLSGYSRAKDYTQKTQALAEERRQVAQQSTQALEALSGRIAELDTVLHHFRAELGTALPSQAEMQRLRAEDPETWIKVRERQDVMAAATQYRERLSQEAKAQKVGLEIEALKRKSAPFAKDFNAEYERLGTYAKSPEGGGLSPEEWDQVDNHKLVLALWKARQYDELTRKSKVSLKPIAALPKTATPGAANAAKRTGEAQYVQSVARVQEQARARGGFNSTQQIAEMIRAREAMKKRKG